MKTLWTLLLTTALLVCVPGTSSAQSSDDSNPNPVITSLTQIHGMTAGSIMKTAEMLDEEMYAYRPSEDVRTAGQILAHLANAQFGICSAAAGEESPSKTNYEETATTKEDIMAALKSGLEYCEGVYAGMTDEKGAEMRKFFGGEMAASAVLAFNSAHNYEHYGNLVTYMRIKGITPPSSM